MQRNITILFLLFCLAFSLKAQNIAIQENFSNTELVQKLFPVNSCMTPSNVQISGHTFSNNKKSFGYFTNTNPSFGLSEGIIITSGKAEAAVGPNRSILSDGPTSWRGDTDLERAINESNTFNATSIEFEIVALTNQLSFDYIFSSEQYLSNPATYQCDYSDGFAFLVKEANNTNAQYTNIALIPNTNLPVKVSNVRARTNNCPESYVQYFGGFNGQTHPTNYNGQTKVLTAKANVTPGVRYKFKLVVADQGNEKYDSAIFLSASSFRNSIDLGLEPNQVFCNNQPYTIAPTPITGVQHYTWYKNGVLINGHNQITNPNLTINESGTYKLVAYINTNCIIEEEVTLNFETPVNVPNLSTNICGTFAQNPTYNIIANSPYGNLFTQNDDISFHYSYNGALNNTDEIPYQTLQNFPLQNNVSTIFVRVLIGDTGCTGIGEFTINTDNLVTTLPTQTLCNLSTTTLDLSTYLPNNLTAGVKIYSNQADANSQQNQINTINSAQVNFQTGQNIFYIKYEDTTTCGKKYILEINILESTDLPVQNINACQGDIVNLQAPNGYMFYNWSTGVNTQNIRVTESGEYIVSLSTNTGCQSSQKFNVIFIAKPTPFNVSHIVCSFDTQNETAEVLVDQIVGNLITTNNTFNLYQSLADAQNITNPISTTVYISQATTFYIREVTVTGCITISQLTLLPNFAINYPTQNFCVTTTQNLDIQTVIQEIQNQYPSSILKIYVTKDNANRDVNPITNNLIPYNTQNVYVKITDSNNSCISNIVIPIQPYLVNNLPNQIANICQDNTVTLQAQSGNYTYLWSTGQSTNNINVNQIGTYVVTLTTPQGCSFTQTFQINHSQSAIITDVVVNHFSNIQNSITIIAEGDGVLEYSLDGINYQNSNIFYGIPAGDYTVYVRDKNGCGIASKDTLVLDIRNFFTPNADGIFDTWDATTIFQVFPKAEVYILDRYNKIMAYLYPNKPAWDGIAFGIPQPSTDYWYVIKLNNGKEYKSHFSLKR